MSMNKCILSRVFADATPVVLSETEPTVEATIEDTKMITIRLSMSHKVATQELAHAAGMNMSKLIRHKLQSPLPVAGSASLKWPRDGSTVITVVIPAKLKTQITQLARAARISRNKWCVLKILAEGEEPAPEPERVPLFEPIQRPTPKLNGEEINPDIVDLIVPKAPVSPDDIFAKEWVRLQPYHVKLESHPTVHLLDPGTNTTLCGVTPHDRGRVKRKWRRCNALPVSCSDCKWRAHKLEQEWT